MESHVGISSKSIALCPYSTGHGVTFTFDSIYDCKISVYFCATEIIDPAAKTSINFSISPGYPPAKSFTFNSGKKQMFPGNLYVLNLYPYKQYITGPAIKYYPLVIRIDSVVPPEVGANASSAIVYCTYTESGGIFGIRTIKEKVIIGNNVFETKAVFGMEKLDSNEDCLICMSNPKTTIIKPCNHVCVCDECASVLLRNQSACPICRTTMTEYSIIKAKE
eukprot:TRINITY_DN8401_c0_g1_i26.p1 TRINITY_DN8401_c0_g1~~TRINITY_DN8401_c0_g1_i26.p1  ORF type:complete len:221 (+),score=43.35 TRINITY_DN8401_c0_g1_i26:417-1079(+)